MQEKSAQAESELWDTVGEALDMETGSYTHLRLLTSDSVGGFVVLCSVSK